MKFAFISEEKVAFPVAVLCRLLAVSPSGFYATQGRPRSLHGRRDDKLAEQVVEAHAASKGRYGSPRRVHAELKAAGERVGRKRVARLMREKKLAARTRRRFRTTTDSKHDFPIAPNVLDRDFTASAPDRAWVTDITFLWTAQGWLYLAVILDLFSRRVVAGRLARTLIATSRSPRWTRRWRGGARPRVSFTTSIAAARTRAPTTERPRTPKASSAA